MKFVKAEEILGGLDAAQQSRLNMYSGNLSMDRADCFFDDRMFDVVSQYALDKNKVDLVREYLRRISFSSSLYSYAQIHEQLMRFTDENHVSFAWNNNFKSAKVELQKEVYSWKLRMLEYRGNTDIIDVIPRKDTHAGYSYVNTGKRKKGEYLEDVFYQYVLEEDRAKKFGSFDKPILIGARTQASGAFDSLGGLTNTFKSKTRLVSMIDIYQIIGEIKFARNFQYAMGMTSWYAGGKDDACVLNHLSNKRGKYNYSLTIDYSHFDQSISDWLIREAFDIVRHAYSGTAAAFDDRLFSVIREDLIHKNFIDGKGIAVGSHKGVPSGSMFTQIVDSVVNRLMISTYLNSKGISERDMMIMGDDNIIFTNQPIDERDLSNYLQHNFGVSVNPDKMSRSKTDVSPEFLSRSWTYNGVYREPNTLLSKLLYAERRRSYELDADANLILYSYVLTFPLGMKELIRVDEFIADHFQENSIDKSDFKWLNGLSRYRAQYIS